MATVSTKLNRGTNSIMNESELLQITSEDLKNIYGEEYPLFESKILPNCYCSRCENPHITTIIKYVTYLDDLDDVILRGLCAKCGGPVSRYLETGEVEKFLPRIKLVRDRYATSVVTSTE